MLFQAIVMLGLSGSGLASPADYPRDTSNYPPLSKSKGFNLIVNLNEPDKDFDPPIHDNFVTTIHVGAGLSKIGTSPLRGPVFFQNGTEESLAAGKSTVITLAGTPATPAGFKLTASDNGGLATGNLDFGVGMPGISIADGLLAYLIPETFYACEEGIDYYHGRKFAIIRHSGDRADAPQHCRAVRLIPQCATLQALAANAYGDYDFALESSCYEEVARIDWAPGSQVQGN